MPDLPRRVSAVARKVRSGRATAAALRDAQALEILVDHPGTVRVRVAVDEQGRRRNRLEVAGRAWAERNAIRVPLIVDHDPGGAWLVSEEIVHVPPHGTDYVDAGLAAAEQISRSQPLSSADAVSGWRAPRLGTARRAKQLWQAGISPRQFVRERAAALALPAQVAVHGDLYDANVLLQQNGSVVLIDWEHAGAGPRHHDAIRFLTTLARTEDAEHALERVLRLSDPSGRESIGIQLRWLSLRHYADQVVADEDVVTEEHADHVRRRWVQATHWADEIARTRP